MQATKQAAHYFKPAVSNKRVTKATTRSRGHPNAWMLPAGNVPVRVDPHTHARIAPDAAAVVTRDSDGTGRNTRASPWCIAKKAGTRRTLIVVGLSFGRAPLPTLICRLAFAPVRAPHLALFENYFPSTNLRPMRSRHQFQRSLCQLVLCVPADRSCARTGLAAPSLVLKDKQIINTGTLFSANDGGTVG